MTEKVKVTYEIAEAIDYFKDKRGDNWKSAVLKEVASAQSDYPSVLSAIVLSGAYSLYDLAEILLKGHETEFTPEDILLKEYKSMNGACTPKTEFGKSAIERRKGFLTALDILGVKVEGVNS